MLFVSTSVVIIGIIIVAVFELIVNQGVAEEVAVVAVSVSTVSIDKGHVRKVTGIVRKIFVIWTST